MKRFQPASLLAGVMLVATSGCAPEGAAERREAWVDAGYRNGEIAAFGE